MTAKLVPAKPGRKSARQTLDAGMSEDELLQAIVEAALFFGWRVHHDRRSDKALQQGSPGFPDLVLAKSGRVLFWECKSEKGGLTPEQFAWSMVLRDGSRFLQYAVIRPVDLDAALAHLAKP
jgi:hypothetical protein